MNTLVEDILGIRAVAGPFLEVPGHGEHTKVGVGAGMGNVSGCVFGMVCLYRILVYSACFHGGTRSRLYHRFASHARPVPEKRKVFDKGGRKERRNHTTLQQ